MNNPLQSSWDNVKGAAIGNLIIQRLKNREVNDPKGAQNLRINRHIIDEFLKVNKITNLFEFFLYLQPISNWFSTKNNAELRGIHFRGESKYWNTFGIPSSGRLLTSYDPEFEKFEISHFKQTKIGQTLQRFIIEENSLLWWMVTQHHADALQTYENEDYWNELWEIFKKDSTIQL